MRTVDWQLASKMWIAEITSKQRRKVSSPCQHGWGCSGACHITLIHSSSQTDLPLHPALKTQHFFITLVKFFKCTMKSRHKSSSTFFPSKAVQNAVSLQITTQPFHGCCLCLSSAPTSTQTTFGPLFFQTLLLFLLHLPRTKHRARTNTTLPLVYLTLKGRIHNTLNLCYKIILSHLNVSKAKLVAVASLH